MLVFASAADGNPADDSFPDDADPARRWRSPSGIAPLAAPDGTPQVMVARSANGGLLHLKLGAVWPALQPNEAPAPVAAGRFRLLLRGPSTRENGQWWPTPIDGQAVVVRSVSLGVAEAAIARHLIERGEQVVEVEVELSIEGYAPAFAWLASVPGATLRDRVAALLGAQPASWEQVEAAFLGLAEDTFTWHPQAPAALRPARDDALRSLAHHAAPLLLQSTADSWSLLTAQPPERIAIDLRVPRRQTRRIALRWSLSAFLDAQPDRARHLLDLSAPAPFEAAPLCILNDMPLAAGGIQEITVEVRTGGPSGLLKHTFRPGEAGTVQLRFVRKTFETLDLQWRARYLVQTPTGLVADATDFRAGTQLIEINPSTLGLKALRLAAEADALAPLQSLDVTVGPGRWSLTRAAPLAWAVRRTPPATAALEAVLVSGERIALGDHALGLAGLTIGSSVLGSGEPLPVALRAPADLPQRAAYLAVQVEGHGWRSVDAGTSVPIVLRRPYRWQLPALRYRTRHVPRAADGTTGAIVESTWRDASGEQIEIGW